MADSLRTTAVIDVMNRIVDTVGPTDTVGLVADRITRGERGAFPIVDDEGHCLGIATRRDLIGQQLPRNAPIGQLASADLVSGALTCRIRSAIEITSPRENRAAP